ncbi:MAG: effector-associated domain EAD1-containing protein [Chloroflexaceae bacterium]
MTHSPDQEDRSRLRQLLTRHFDRSELQTLCFELGVAYDDLPEGGRVDKIRELITYLERRGRIPDLIAVGRRLRPDVAWDATPETPDAAAAAGNVPATPPPTTAPTRTQSLSQHRAHYRPGGICGARCVAA